MSNAYDASRPQPIPNTSRRTFGEDILFSFLFFIEPTNIITFMVIWIANFAGLFVLAVAGGGIWVGQFFPGARVLPIGIIFMDMLVFAFIFALYLRIVAETADGEDILPLTSGEGFIEDFIKPIFTVNAIVICLFAPTLLLAILAARMGFEIPPILVKINAFVALALFPITILVVSIGGVSALVRIDLIVVSVFRSFGAYLVIWFFLIVAFAASFVLIRYMFTPTTPGGTSIVGNHPLPASLAITLVISYSFVVAMRVIGLYYRHHRHLFAWSWE